VLQTVLSTDVDGEIARFLQIYSVGWGKIERGVGVGEVGGRE
jgi:hypothetical protein